MRPSASVLLSVFCLWPSSLEPHIWSLSPVMDITVRVCKLLQVWAAFCWWGNSPKTSSGSFYRSKRKALSTSHPSGFFLRENSKSWDGNAESWNFTKPKEISSVSTSKPHFSISAACTVNSGVQSLPLTLGSYLVVQCFVGRDPLSEIQARENPVQSVGLTC